MDAINDGNGFLCDSHCGLKLDWALWVIFWWDACQCMTLDWLLEPCILGMDRTSEARINCKLCVMWFITLTFSTCRWSKTRPERHQFPAGINPSLPQATHPQGTSWVYGWVSLTLSCSLNISVFLLPSWLLFHFLWRICVLKRILSFLELNQWKNKWGENYSG